MLLNYIVLFIPITFLVGNWLMNIGNGNIKPISNVQIILFVMIMAISMGCHPFPEFSDRANYADLYMSIYNDTYYGEYKDIGWQFLVTVCTYLFSDNVQIFFIFVSFIYCFSYCCFAKHQFEKGYAGYFIILAFGCLGFTTYGIVMIRSSFALGLLALALSFNKPKSVKIGLAISSIFIHVTMIIPVFFFLLAKYLRKDSYVYSFWAICFILSILNFDLSSYIEVADSLDSRIYHFYTNNTDRYDSGYRTDFLIYSVIPVVIVFWLKKKGLILSDLYKRLFNTYILTNAVWLLVIRMAYTNRIAYLSWVLIPYLVLYPVINNRNTIRNSRTIMYRIMALFVVTYIVLSLKDILMQPQV